MLPRTRRTLLAVPLLTALLASTACSSEAGGPPAQVKLGYFPNVTHAAALIGVDQKFIQGELGAVPLKTQTFNAGPSAMEALLGGGVDATYVGPSPAVNTFIKTYGEELRIVAGASSGGASLVVQPEIAELGDLKGKKLATPQLGGTQDVAARSYLQSKGLATSTDGSGDVSIVPQENAQTLDQFKQKAIAGAWLPEPWASRVVAEAGGKVLVDERDLWPDKTFATTLLVVRTGFLKKHPDQVRALVAANEKSIAFAKDHPAEAETAINAQLKLLTGKPLDGSVLHTALGHLSLTDDPIVASIAEQATRATSLGFVKKYDLAGLVDLTILNDVRKTRNLPAIPDAGLGGKK